MPEKSGVDHWYDSLELASNRWERELDRNFARQRNSVKWYAGRFDPPVGQTPRELVWQREKVCLYRYRRTSTAHATPVLLVMSLVSKAYIFDLRPGSSFVEVLLAHGLDVYMLDWGVPDELEADYTFETYCDGFIPKAVKRVCKISGSEEVSIVGYCFGGNLATLYAAGHPSDPIRSLTVIATPADFSKVGPLASMTREGRLDADDIIDVTGNVPAQFIVDGFNLTQPFERLSGFMALQDRMWDESFIATYQAVQGWAQDQIPFPGGVMRQTIAMFNRANALMTDDVVLGGRRVHLRDITCSFLSVIASNDAITPPDASAPMIDLVGSIDKTEMRLTAGHVGIIMGRTARLTTMPAIASWIADRSGDLPPSPRARRSPRKKAPQPAVATKRASRR